MDRSVSAAEANRNFSSLLRSVAEGETITVTSHGRPVARITPIDAGGEARRAALADHLDELRRKPAMPGIGRWRRDEAYEG